MTVRFEILLLFFAPPPTLFFYRLLVKHSKIDFEFIVNALCEARGIYSGVYTHKSAGNILIDIYQGRGNLIYIIMSYDNDIYGFAL